MLRVLLASQPARGAWLGGTTFSTVTHGTLIALAVVATNHTYQSVRERRAAEAVERITYVEPASIAAALRAADEVRATRAREAVAKAARAAEAAAKEAAEQKAAQELADLQTALANEPIPEPDMTAATDLTAVTDAWLAQPDEISGSSTSVAGLLFEKAGLVAPKNGVYAEDMVERSVEPRRGNPTPRYPAALADLGIEGDFVVRFVVDSTGAVAEDRIEFPSTMHRLFVSAVRTALQRSRYVPAMVAGHFVAQQVVQEFRFEMRHRR